MESDDWRSCTVLRTNGWRRSFQLCLKEDSLPQRRSEHNGTTRAGFEPEESSQSESKREPTYEELMARLRKLEREADSMGVELPWKTVQPSSASSELKGAFLDSARPDSPAPLGWWVLPVMGIVGSLFLLRFTVALGTICLVLTSSFFGFCVLRAKRNRPRRTPVA